MLDDMFDYVETKEEMISSFDHFNTYYKKVKDSLKSDYVTQVIGKIVMLVKNYNMLLNIILWMLAPLDFEWSGIVEAANSGMKYRSVRVTTNMNTNLSGSRQIKIGENQTKRKNR